jgi:hypothetical protein
LDHFNADQNTVKVESPGNFGPATAHLTGGGDGYSTYQADITDATPAATSIDLLIEIESEQVGYLDVLPDNHITSYFTYTAKVGGSPQTMAPTAIMFATTPTSIPYGGDVSFDASESTGTAPLTFIWDFNGDGTFDGTGDEYTGDSMTPTHTFNKACDTDVTVKVSNAYGMDISDPVNIHVTPSGSSTDVFVDADYPGSDSDGTTAKPFTTIQAGVNAVTAGHTVHVDYYDGGTHIYDTEGLTLKSNFTLVGDNWNCGGPGKPILKNNNGTFTIGSSYTAISDFTLDGFEVGIGEQTGNLSNFGISFYSYGGVNNNITVTHCHFTGTIDDTGKTSGPGSAIWAGNCDNSHFEYNDVGPMTWRSDTPGVYARVLWGMYFDGCDNTEVKNNYIHDITIDYDGQTGLWGQIRVFCLHSYNCVNINVHNNLICHIDGINDYDYRIEGMMMEGYSGGASFHYYNNTVDELDHSQSNGNFPLRGIFCYDNNAPGTYINNSILTNFMAPAGQGGSIQAFYSTTDTYPITYSTGYNLGTINNYFYGFITGDGCTNYPGVNPMYVNNTTSPYDYHFQSGSGCEMGDPNFIDFDDTGAPSGNPSESDKENRSRMGCFGGPDGDWDPNNL